MMVKTRPGFSLIEISIVLFIIGILATMIGPKAIKYFSEGKKRSTESTLLAVKLGLTEYYRDMGHFPKKLEDLVANPGNNPKWNGTYITGRSEVPLDGWDREIVYNHPPQVNKDKYRQFEVISYGEHGDGSPQEEWLHKGE